MQTKKQPYTLTSLRLALISIGPKKSTPVFLNTIPGSGLHSVLLLRLYSLAVTVTKLEFHVLHGLTGLKVNDQLVAHATRFFVRLKHHV